MVVSKEYLSNSGIRYMIIDMFNGSGRATVDKKEYTITKIEENVEHIKGLINRINMSEYILKPIDYIEDNGEFFAVTRAVDRGMVTLTNYIENAEKFDDISFRSLCDAAINLIDNFQILHYYNLAYSSVTTDDIFVKLKTGKIVFGGCERLQRPLEARLFAPDKMYALSSSDSCVNIYDDYFAMFTTLFRIFYLTFPIIGEQANAGKYIFSDEQNILQPELANAFLYRRLYPAFFTKMFDDFFSGFLIGEVEAKETLMKLKYSLTMCDDPECRAENFYTGGELRCWKCGKTISPIVLEISGDNGNTVVLTNGCTISRNDIFHDGVFNSFVGVVVRNPKDKNMYGIKNLLPYAISFTKKDGTTIDLQPNQAAPIALGIVINFTESVRAEIKLANVSSANLSGGKVPCLTAAMLELPEHGVSLFRAAAENQLVLVTKNELEVYDA